jgi:hypothetical protein
MQIRIAPRKVLSATLIVISVLLFAQITGLIFTYFLGHDYIYGLIPLFDFDNEANIPTAYSALQLFVATTILAVICISKRSVGENYFYWLALTLIFALLTYDELFQVHEVFILPLREKFSLSGLLYFAWVIPYGIAAVILAIAFLRFIFGLPRKTSRLIILSGATYLSGALGFEMLGGFAASSFGESSGIYALAATIEELLEMVGIALFIYSLLSYMSTYMSSLRLEIED